MTIPRTVQHCRWAEPTLFVMAPNWTDAWAYPWSCRAGGAAHVVVDTRVCETCVRWVERDERRQSGGTFDRATQR